jgi:integrase
MIFPSMTGTLQDPNNLGKKWRRVRDELGVFDVTTHSFGKTFVMLIDDKGLSARIASDQLGHSKVSMTTDRYMARQDPHRGCRANRPHRKRWNGYGMKRPNYSLRRGRAASAKAASRIRR